MKMTAIKNIILATVMSFTATFALGQENWDGHKYGTDTVKAQKSEAMFNQYFKARDYQSVYPYWEYLFNNALWLVNVLPSTEHLLQKNT